MVEIGKIAMAMLANIMKAKEFAHTAEQLAQCPNF